MPRGAAIFLLSLTLVWSLSAFGAPSAPPGAVEAEIQSLTRKVARMRAEGPSPTGNRRLLEIKTQQGKILAMLLRDLKFASGGPQIMHDAASIVALAESAMRDLKDAKRAEAAEASPSRVRLKEKWREYRTQIRKNRLLLAGTALAGTVSALSWYDWFSSGFHFFEDIALRVLGTPDSRSFGLISGGAALVLGNFLLKGGKKSEDLWEDLADRPHMPRVVADRVTAFWDGFARESGVAAPDSTDAKHALLEGLAQGLLAHVPSLRGASRGMCHLLLTRPPT